MTTSAVSNLKMEIRDGNHSSYIETIVNVTSNIILYTRKYHQPFLKILYEIECNLPADCFFELNFHESQNILLIDQNGNEIKDNLILKSKISPYNRVYLGEVRVDDPTYRSVLKSKYNWRKIGLLMKNVNEIALRDKKIRITEIENVKRLILPFNRNRPEATIELFSHHGIRHIDVDFLPDLSFHDGNDISDENKGPRKFDITWRRASEIFEKDLCIFPPSMDLSPSTLCKGPLSSLIFLQTVYSLCECPAIIKNLFTSNNSHFNNCGMYQVCLCLNGSWTFVSLDEFLPCFPTPDNTGGLVCSKLRYHSALWLPLLEKAICKHYLTYSLSKTPLTQEDILFMCTGAPVISIGDGNRQLELNPSYVTNFNQNRLWNQLIEYLENNYLIIGKTIPTLAKIDPRRGQVFLTTEKGLVLGNTSYTLLQLIETSTNEYIMQFRHPFDVSDFEWTGDWSDRSSKWSAELENEIGPDQMQQPNTFWISFTDFLHYFSKVTICLVCGEEINHREWNEHRFRTWFQLVKPTESSYYPLLSNMYLLKVSNSSANIHFTIHQLLTRSYLQYDIGLAILRVTPDYTFELVTTTGITVSQYVTVTACLTPDVYLLVPITTGAILSAYNERNQFHTTTSSTSELKPIQLYDNHQKKFIDRVDDAFSEIFDRLDNDMDDVLTREELEIYLKTKEGNDLRMEDDVYEWLITNFDSFDGGLTRLGYKQTQLYMLQCSGHDENIIWNDLIQMGYNYQLNLHTAFTTVLNIHSDSEDISLRQQKVDKFGYLEAIELIIKQRSTNIIEYAEGLIRVYEYQNSTGFSLGVENYSPQTKTIEVKFINDDDNDDDIISHRGALETMDTLQSGKFSIIQHVFCLSKSSDMYKNDSKQRIQWNYEINIC